MTLIKKRDVKEHFAARRRARSHPYKAPSQPDATGFSGSLTKAVPLNPSGFVKDFVAEHSADKKPIAPGADEGLETL
jgi:hypothetical protein